MYTLIEEVQIFACLYRVVTVNFLIFLFGFVIYSIVIYVSKTFEVLFFMPVVDICYSMLMFKINGVYLRVLNDL